jgi:hypothetical protein
VIDLSEVAGELNAAPVAPPASLEQLQRRVQFRRARRRIGLVAMAITAVGGVVGIVVGLDNSSSNVVNTVGPGTTVKSGPTTGSPGVPFPRESSDPVATRTALEMLDSLTVPAEATPARLTGGVFDLPWSYPYCDPLVDKTRYWTVKAPIQQVVAFFQAHPIPGVSEAIPGTLTDNGIITAYGFLESPRNPSNHLQQGLTITVAPYASGTTGIRADALVVPTRSQCKSSGGSPWS